VINYTEGVAGMNNEHKESKFSEFVSWWISMSFLNCAAGVAILPLIFMFKSWGYSWKLVFAIPFFYAGCYLAKRIING